MIRRKMQRMKTGRSAKAERPVPLGEGLSNRADIYLFLFIY